MQRAGVWLDSGGWVGEAHASLARSLPQTYVLRQLRMNSDEVKLLLSYPSPWAVCLRRPEAPTQVRRGTGGGRSRQGGAGQGAACGHMGLSCLHRFHAWKYLLYLPGSHSAPPPPPLGAAPQNECVAQRPQQPTYKELEVLLRSVPW